MRSLLFLDCCLDKTKHFKSSLWALGNFAEQFFTILTRHFKTKLVSNDHENNDQIYQQQTNVSCSSTVVLSACTVTLGNTE